MYNTFVVFDIFSLSAQQEQQEIKRLTENMFRKKLMVITVDSKRTWYKADGRL